MALKRGERNILFVILSVDNVKLCANKTSFRRNGIGGEEY